MYLLLITALLYVCSAGAHIRNGTFERDIISILNVTTVSNKSVKIFWRLNTEGLDHAHVFKLEYDGCRNDMRCYQEYEINWPVPSHVEPNGVFSTVEACDNCHRYRVVIKVFDLHGTCCGRDEYQSHPEDLNPKTNQPIIQKESHYIRKNVEERDIQVPETGSKDTNIGDTFSPQERDTLLYVVSGIAVGLFLALVVVVAAVCVYCRRQSQARGVTKRHIEAGEPELPLTINPPDEDDSRLDLIRSHFKETIITEAVEHRRSLHSASSPPPPGYMIRNETSMLQDEGIESYLPSSGAVSSAQSEHSVFFH